MKKIAFLLFCNVFLVINIINAQQNVGIGTTNPHASALLELSANDKGLLIPRVTLTALNNSSPVTSPAPGLLVFNTTTSTLPSGFYYWNGTQWTMVGGGGCTTLEAAYNCGGAGAGRIINANSGAVEIKLASSGTSNKALLVTNNRPNSFAIDAITNVAGVAIRGNNTSASNPYATIQAETNSTYIADDGALNSAILGSNSGNGYGVAGQIPATSNGKVAVFGNNLRTTVNTAGIWGVGFAGVCGETNNPTQGWAGYFFEDIYVGGGGYAENGWNNISDKRLKSNIQPIPNALQKISQISGNTYTLKTPTKDANGNITTKERVQYGVIAQDIEPIFPEIVSEKAIFNNLGDETVYKTVNYDGLIPVLIEAVKELKAEVDALKKEIEELKK